METLRQKQSRFALMAGQLILKADAMGYAVTFAEAYRTPEQAALNAKAGTGIKNSLHSLRLAIDLNIFRKDGTYLTNGDDFKDLGEWWESIGGTWGGRFKDGNHFSLSHGGIK